jgi:hypothetical protein
MTDSILIQPANADNNLKPPAVPEDPPSPDTAEQPPGTPPAVPEDPPSPDTAEQPPGNPIEIMLHPSVNPLDEFFNSARLDMLPEGIYPAEIPDWSLTRDVFGELRSSMIFKLVEGELSGMEYEDRKKAAGRSFGFLRQALETAAATTIREAGEVYDHIANRAGPIRDRVVGAVVEIRVVHKPVDGRVYCNLYVAKLLRPAPTGTSRNVNS